MQKICELPEEEPDISEAFTKKHIYPGVTWFMSPWALHNAWSKLLLKCVVRLWSQHQGFVEGRQRSWWYFLPTLLPRFSLCYSFTMFLSLFSSTLCLLRVLIQNLMFFCTDLQFKLKPATIYLFIYLFKQKFHPGPWNHTIQITWQFWSESWMVGNVLCSSAFGTELYNQTSENTGVIHSNLKSMPPLAGRHKPHLATYWNYLQPLQAA